MNILQRTIVTMVSLVIISIAIFIFIIQPTIIDIKTFDDRIQMERVALENKYTSRRNIKNIIADLKYVTDNMDPIMNNIVIQKGKEVNFISDLEAIANKYNIVQKITINSAGVLDKDKIAERRNMTIVLSGKYTDVLKYVTDLEQSSLYVMIYGIDISSGSNKPSQVASSGDVKANLQSYVYFAI